MALFPIKCIDHIATVPIDEAAARRRYLWEVSRSVQVGWSIAHCSVRGSGNTYQLYNPRADVLL